MTNSGSFVASKKTHFMCGRCKWPSRDPRKRIVKVKKTIFAIPAAAAAIPANPKNAAINATMKNPKAHFSISPPEKIVLDWKSQKFTGRFGLRRHLIGCNHNSVSPKISYVVLFLHDVPHWDICIKVKKRDFLWNAHKRCKNFTHYLRTRTAFFPSSVHLEGAIVASHFKISRSTNRFICTSAGEFHRAFPITRSKFCPTANFLFEQFCFCHEGELELRNRDTPLDRINHARHRTFPNCASRLQRKIRNAQVRGFSVCIDVGAGGERINRSVFAAKNEKH